jgi:hypothetical protein
MHKLKSLKLIGFFLVILFSDAFAARTVCQFNNSVLASNEVLIKAETNIQSCAVPGVGSPTRYTIENIALVQANSLNEKVVCGGWKLPLGYTVKRREFSSICPNQKADHLVLNNAPRMAGYNYATAKNTSLTASATTTDTDNDSLIYSLNNTSGNSPSSKLSQKGGSVSINSSTGQFTYNPPANLESQDFFTIYALDQKSDPVSIDVFVTVGTPVSGNRPPQFDYSFANNLIAEMNFKKSFAPVASDLDGDTVTITLDTSALPLNGKIFTFTNSLGTLIVTYIPNKDFVGVDYVKFIATDARGGITKGSYPITVAFVDSDSDGIADWYEQDNNLNYLNAADAVYDTDNDGLSSLGEYLAGTKLNSADTDFDLLPDGYEVDNEKFNPLVADSQDDFDVDGYTNYQEYLAKTNPNNKNDTPATPFFAWLVPIINLLMN